MDSNKGWRDEIYVISGMSGKFPKSSNVDQFLENLISKADLLSTCFEHKRHSPMLNSHRRHGVLDELGQFDYEFFHIQKSRVPYMDILLRNSLEPIIEALFDAGLSLEEIKNTNTGVYGGLAYYESEKVLLGDKYEEINLIDSCKCLCASQVSYFFQLTGPSHICDTACSSSLYAVHRAYEDLREGKCERAIVFGANSILNENVSAQFNSLGVISASGFCKPFDADGDGYVRSECMGAIIIEKKSMAKREYVELVHCDVNSDGYKEMGITFPSSAGQKLLLERFYEDCPVPLSQIGFVEAHGTGTRAGDPEELRAICEFYCKDRTDTLLVGSVKSNVGHSEPSSGISSIIKCCLISHTGYVIPNMCYKKPRDLIKEYLKGCLKVATELTPVNRDTPYLAINNFGFGGANGHLLLKIPTTLRKLSSIDSERPMLVCVSGRHDGAVDALLDGIAKNQSKEFIYLIHSIFKYTIDRHHVRAFGILSKSGFGKIQKCKTYNESKPLICLFSNEVINVGDELSSLTIWQAHLQQVKEILAKNELRSNSSFNNKNGTRESLLNTVIVQTGMIQVLKKLEIEMSQFCGEGIGQLSAAYADNVFNLEQTILAAYYVTKISNETDMKLKEEMTRILEDICKVAGKPKKWFITNNENNSLADKILCNQKKAKCKFLKKFNYIILGSSRNERSNVITLTRRNSAWELLGRLYLLGYNASLENLYDKPETPVIPETAMASPLIKWVKKECPFDSILCNEAKKISNEIISLDDYKWNFVEGHVIDGRVLFPATGYLFLVWQTVFPMYQNAIIFEEVRFLRACTVPKTGDLALTVQINKYSGNFEVLDHDAVVVSGRVAFEQNVSDEWYDLEALPQPDVKNQISKKDIYKELNLRGYGYQKQFRELLDVDVDCTVGHIQWTHWIPFMDIMLQMKILEQDSRALYVPVKIAKIIIDPVKHIMLMPYYEQNPTASIPVYNYKDLNIIRAGFIEMRGLTTSNLSKRKQPIPVLEANKFVPYNCHMEINEATRVIAQICLENSYTVHLKATEVYADVPADFQPILPMIQDALNDQPLIQHDLILYSNSKNLDIPGISISSNVGSENACFMTIAFNLSTNIGLRNKLMKGLKPNGYLLSREPKTAKAEEEFENLVVIAQYWTEKETLLLLQVQNEAAEKEPVQVDVSGSGFNWLSQLQQARKNKDDILLFSQNEVNNGLMGLSNCILREAGQERIMAFLIQDENAPKFDINSSLYRRQFKKGLSVNVLRDGIWGSYRHLLMAKSQPIDVNHALAHYKTKGDLSSLYWTEGPLSISNNLEFSQADFKNKSVQVYASGVNFRDVMLATGKISVENIDTDRRNYENPIGLEFAGKLLDGTRVMGFTKGGGISNYVQAEPDFLFRIPDEMSMEEAATIPTIYLTNIYGLFIKGNLRRGESILIHSATGGIGMSALNIAIHYQCTIFVTVGTEEKRQFIMKTYPQIPEAHIGNSRDTSFYNLIMKETKGQGVDLVLNSLADEKLQSSVCCLAQKGRMIEIGKYDLFNDSQLQLELTKREAEYHGVMLDYLLVIDEHECKSTLAKMFVSGLKEGFIKPIFKTVFEKSELEQSFRYLTTGKHMGKVIIKIRDEETEHNVAKPITIVAEPRFQCDVTGVYIIAGGLGGCGLEIADWLVIKGAKTLVLVSRRGITTGYQSYRIKMWESYGVRIVISTDDIRKRECCEQLLRSANKLGPVIGIFNLAVVLKDSIVENQTVDTFQESYEPKAQITINLDELTRILCPHLQHFVVFSSVSCGRGNAGQTNYGYSNSVMERICERRKMEGLPGLAIQWGVIGDVGIVADYKEENIEVVIGGTLSQRIGNCLETMELFMVSDEPIMSSIVVAEKKLGGSDSSIIDVIAEALQIKDIKTVGHNLTLPEIGMDSIMAVEIKQKLEREFDLFLSPQELRNMTLAKLVEMSTGEQEQLEDNSDKIGKNIDALKEVFPSIEHFSKTVKSLDSLGGETQIFFIPGVECTSMLLETIASNLKSSAKCLQFNYSNMKQTVYEYADELAKVLENNCDPGKPIFLCSYSLGTSTAIEVLSILERLGRKVVLIILDGSTEFSKSVITDGDSKINVNDMDLDFFIILKILELVLPSFDLETNKFKEGIKSAKSWDERLRIAIKWTNAASTQHPEEHIFEYMSCINRRIRAELGYEMKRGCSFKSDVHLCKATIPIVKGLDEDYGLGKVFSKNLKVKEFQGDHRTFLQNPELVNYIQEIINLNT